MYLELESRLISSPCPLLAAERAEEYLPSVCMAVPKNSAWVAMQVDVSSYLNGQHEIDLSRLEQALCACIDEGDQRHDDIEWKEPPVAYDSWLNRRLAIALRGWGDVVAVRGADPQSIATLRELEELMDRCCRVLHEYSRLLANKNSHCPALDETGARILKKDRSRAWGRRWRRAIASEAVRHRNLSTMSPWDVFPRDSPADMRYADLLPLTRFVDSLSFQCETVITGWSAAQFARFKARVSAQAQCGGTSGLIAKQV